MPRQVRTTPRKQPRQSRSRETVSTILAATSRVLVKRGFDGLTTNAVAAAAGVSIGSLYQYFPNKEALVAGLIDDHIERLNGDIVAELSRVALLPIAQAARRVIELRIRAHSIDPELHRVLIEQVPRIGKLAKLRQFDEITNRVVAALLEARKAELAIESVELAAFMLVASIEAIIQRTALFYPERMRDPRLVDEATLLVTRYLGVAAS